MQTVRNSKKERRPFNPFLAPTAPGVPRKLGEREETMFVELIGSNFGRIEPEVQTSLKPWGATPTYRNGGRKKGAKMGNLREVTLREF